MSITPSSASQDLIEAYTTGSCHILAAALHKKFGWRMLAVLDYGEMWWVDEDDPDNGIPSVIHVYALDENDNAWDIRGVRPRDEIRQEAEELFNILEYASDECRSMEELLEYVTPEELEPGDIEKPLCAYTERDVDVALVDAIAVLSHLPGFPQEASPKVG